MEHISLWHHPYLRFITPIGVPYGSHCNIHWKSDSSQCVYRVLGLNSFVAFIMVITSSSSISSRRICTFHGAPPVAHQLCYCGISLAVAIVRIIFATAPAMMAD